MAAWHCGSSFSGTFAPLLAAGGKVHSDLFWRDDILWQFAPAKRKIHGTVVVQRGLLLCRIFHHQLPIVKNDRSRDLGPRGEIAVIKIAEGLWHRVRSPIQRRADPA